MNIPDVWNFHFLSFRFSFSYFREYFNFTNMGIARSTAKTLHFTGDLESRYLLILALPKVSVNWVTKWAHHEAIRVFTTQNASPLPKTWCLWSSWFQRRHVIGVVYFISSVGVWNQSRFPHWDVGNQGYICVLPFQFSFIFDRFSPLISLGWPFTVMR